MSAQAPSPKASAYANPGISSPPQPQLHETLPVAVQSPVLGSHTPDNSFDPLSLSQHRNEINKTELKELYPDAKRRRKVQEFYTRLVCMPSLRLDS